MTRAAATVATSFRDRIQRFEEDRLSAARHAFLPGAARAPGGGLRPPHAVPARPRPDRALQGVPPAQAQDAGVHLARGRPLPHPPDPHARGLRDRPQRGPGAGAQRGPDRGDRARPRPRPPAVRARRRGGARRLRARALRARFRHNHHSLRVVERLEREGRGLNLTEQVRDGILRHTGSEEPPATLEGGSCGWWTGSPTSTTTSTTPSAPACSRPTSCRAAEIELLGETGPERIETLVRDVLERSEPVGDVVQGDEVGGAMLRLREFMFEHVYLGAAPCARSRGSSACCAPCSPTTPSTRRRDRPGRHRTRARGGLPRRNDRPLRRPDLHRPVAAAGF